MSFFHLQSAEFQFQAHLNTMAAMFPRHIIEFIGNHHGTSSVPENVAHLARSHEDISVLFLDIVGFTSMAKEADPQDVMLMLNTLFSVFDQLCLSHGVHKVLSLKINAFN